MAKVTPFVVESNQQFLSKGPNALTSGQYTKEYNEVKALGVAGLARTGEQLAVFNFFQANPVEMFSRSFRTYALGEGLGVVEQARLFGLWPRGRGHQHHVLGGQGALELLAAADGHSARRHGREPEDGRSTVGRPQSRLRRTPTTRRATTARPAST